MAIDSNFHTWAVGWLKIILPMGALALLSTLFLFARSPANQGQDIPIAQIEEIAQEQQITAPQFSGVADDGSVIVVRAKSGQPDQADANRLLIEDISMDVDAPDGTTLAITSDTSILDSANQTARLDGLSRVTTSSGYVMETNGINADLKTGDIVSDGRLAIQAPFGDLTAGKVRIHVSADGTGQQMVFTEGVRLLYTPQPDAP